MMFLGRDISRDWGPRMGEREIFGTDSHHLMAPYPLTQQLSKDEARNGDDEQARRSGSIEERTELRRRRQRGVGASVLKLPICAASLNS